jgi:hypothetical protein
MRAHKEPIGNTYHISNAEIGTALTVTFTRLLPAIKPTNRPNWPIVHRAGVTQLKKCRFIVDFGVHLGIILKCHRTTLKLINYKI